MPAIVDDNKDDNDDDWNEETEEKKNNKGEQKSANWQKKPVYCYSGWKKWDRCRGHIAKMTR